MPSSIVGVDIATQGACFAIDGDGAHLSSLHWNFTKQKDGRAGLFGKLLRGYVQNFSESPTLIYELPFSGSFQSATVMHQMIGALMLVAEEEGCDYIGVNSARIRSHMGIKGQKRDIIKPAIEAWAQKEYPSHVFKTQDECDAALAARWFLQQQSNDSISSNENQTP